MAEEERFELSKDIATFGHLANAWFQPLTHSSSSGSLSGRCRKIPVATRLKKLITSNFYFTTLNYWS